MIRFVKCMAALAVGASAITAEGPNDGKETTASVQGPINAEVVVRASLQDAWNTWATNEGIQTFFSQYSNVKLEIGGPYEILFDGKIGSNGCKILSYLPEEMLSFSWNAPPQFEHARGQHTWVVLHFDQVSSKETRVRLAHLGWEEMKSQFPDHASEWDQVRDYFADAWPRVLDHLKQRFEQGPRWR